MICKVWTMYDRTVTVDIYIRRQKLMELTICRLPRENPLFAYL